MSRLRATLPTVAKKYVWNVKYGLLGYPHFVAPEDVVRYLSARLSEPASILELGCGRGSLLRGLRETGWAGSYCGVDISKQAINDARKCTDQRSSWVVSDFESFRTPFTWDIIVMIESICYVKLNELPVFLNGVMGMLNESGIMLIRLHDFNKHQEYVEAVQGLYADAERVSPNLLCVARSVREPAH